MSPPTHVPPGSTMYIPAPPEPPDFVSLSEDEARKLAKMVWYHMIEKWDGWDEGQRDYWTNLLGKLNDGPNSPN